MSDGRSLTNSSESLYLCDFVFTDVSVYAELAVMQEVGETASIQFKGKWYILETPKEAINASLVLLQRVTFKVLKVIS